MHRQDLIIEAYQQMLRGDTEVLDEGESIDDVIDSIKSVSDFEKIYGKRLTNELGLISSFLNSSYDEFDRLVKLKLASRRAESEFNDLISELHNLKMNMAEEWADKNAIPPELIEIMNNRGLF